MNLEDGLREYALTSALHDTRFSPISLKEVPSLTCTVSLLTDFEAAVSHLDWEIGKHGVWIEFRGKRGERRTATFLPQIASEQGWTKLETIDQLLRKGGYHDEPTQEMYGAIKLTRYQSKKAELTYSEYVAME
ncbi:hypothetical protein LPJ53_001809 [Coemansia erecta]|uniref:AMMECR1 domain-containing protein n=1 Tax=Coemansia erecta TaxID=147472 RepID=A0A9W7Y5M3_9FUNG|nr:hypothetical protein LPJ53_001809 [Coemansia erecta]